MSEVTATRVHDPMHRSSYSFRREGETLWVS